MPVGCAVRIGATVGRSQDVCKGARFPVEGERCVGSSPRLFERLQFNDEEEEVGCTTNQCTMHLSLLV